MTFTVRPLDIDSDHDIAGIHALRLALTEWHWGVSTPRPLDAVREVMRSSAQHEMRVQLLTTVQDGEEKICGYVRVSLPQQDNLNLTWLDYVLRPEDFRTEVEEALVDKAVIPLVREAGRPLVTYWAGLPMDADPKDPTQMPLGAQKLNLRCTAMGISRKLRLPMPDAVVAEIEADIAEKIGDYRLLSWDSTVPEEYLEQYAKLLYQLELDDPLEDMEYERPQFDAARVREREEEHRRSGERVMVTVAVAPDGTLAGNTELFIKESPRTRFAFQGNTLVMPEHRGHRLAAAMKLANQRAACAALPELEVVGTNNSHVNPHMVAINERFGFVPVFRTVGFQGQLEV